MKLSANIISFINEVLNSMKVIKNAENFFFRKNFYLYENNLQDFIEIKNYIDMNSEKSVEAISNFYCKKEKLKFYFDFVLHTIKKKKNNFLSIKNINKELEEELKKNFYTLIQNRIFSKTPNEEKKDVELLVKFFEEKLKGINFTKLYCWIGNLLERNLLRSKIVNFF